MTRATHGLRGKGDHGFNSRKRQLAELRRFPSMVRRQRKKLDGHVPLCRVGAANALSFARECLRFVLLLIAALLSAVLRQGT
jgi:hypothetical protein